MFQFKDKEPKGVFDTLDGERFIEAFMIIKERKLMKLFLRDLFTEKELNQFMRRFEAAYWLSMGTPYSQIQAVTGLSPNVIARVSDKFRDKKGGMWLVMVDIYPHKKPHFSETGLK